MGLQRTTPINCTTLGWRRVLKKKLSLSYSMLTNATKLVKLSLILESDLAPLPQTAINWGWGMNIKSWYVSLQCWQWPNHFDCLSLILQRSWNCPFDLKYQSVTWQAIFVLTTKGLYNDIWCGRPRMNYHSVIAWPPWCRKLTMTRLFDKQPVDANSKEHTKSHIIGILWRESTRAPSQYKDRLIYVWWFPC